MACRTGCKTQDHASWAECARDANVRVTATTTSRNRDGYDQTKRDLRAYREARGAGIQPEGTTMDKIEAAKTATKAMGRPYDASTDPPASMITTKKAAKFVSESGGAQ
jgi:hypothetical protein